MVGNCKSSAEGGADGAKALPHFTNPIKNTLIMLL